MPFQSDLPPALLLGPVIAAVAVYLVLRWVIWAPRTGSSPETVSQHALWVGVIGWMAGSLQAAMNIGIIPANAAAGTALLTPDAIVPALAWPVLGCLGVHAVGQLSYPRPRRPRRRAILAVRRIRDFLPRHLAWTAAAIFGGAAGFIAWTGTLPAYGNMSWTNAAALAGMGVLLAMLFWPPARLAGAPRLRAEHASPAARAHPGQRDS